jgi:hypothetical protein
MRCPDSETLQNFQVKKKIYNKTNLLTIYMVIIFYQSIPINRVKVDEVHASMNNVKDPRRTYREEVHEELEPFQFP